MNVSHFIGVCAVVLLSATGVRAADVSAGQIYFNKNCANCHGKTAKGVASFPSLRDRNAAYISDRLSTYRARGKVGPNSAIMYSHAGKLNDDKIANIAVYLSTKFGTEKSIESTSKVNAETTNAEKNVAKTKPSSVPKAKAEQSGNTGVVACSQEQGEALGECTVRVERGKTDKITVTATFANGFTRRLFFKDGSFLKASATMSGVGTDTDWKLEDGKHFIRVDDQRYEIPVSLFAARETAAKEPTAPVVKKKASQTSKSEEVSALADIAKGKKHFRKNCRACHGSKAQGVASYPELAGQSADYLAMRLKQYRAGEKLGPNTPLMAPRAKKLSDQDIANLVAYIGTFN